MTILDETVDQINWKEISVDRNYKKKLIIRMT